MPHLVSHKFGHPSATGEQFSGLPTARPKQHLQCHQLRAGTFFSDHKFSCGYFSLLVSCHTLLTHVVRVYLTMSIWCHLKNV